MDWAVSELLTAQAHLTASLGRYLGAVKSGEPWQCYLCSQSKVGPAWECNHSLGMKPCPGWEWNHNQFGLLCEPCCPVSLEAPLDEVGCIGHLQAWASKDVYLGFPKESSPMLLGSGGP